IAALAKAAFVFDRADWQDAGAGAFRFIETHMMMPDGRLHHTWCAGKGAHPATLEDYAALCDAALALHENTQDKIYLEAARRWAGILLRDYADPQGGFFMTPAVAADLPLRPRNADDTATPAGNGMIVGVFNRLHGLTGEARWQELAEKTARAFSAFTPP